MIGYLLRVTTSFVLRIVWTIVGKDYMKKAGIYIYTCISGCLAFQVKNISVLSLVNRNVSDTVLIIFLIETRESS